MSEDMYRSYIIGFSLVLLAFVGFGAILIVDSVDAIQDEKQAQVIFDKYIQEAEDANGLSEEAKINLEYELKELGYSKVEIVVPEVTKTGDYPILVSVYKYNRRGGIRASQVFKKSIKITI